MLHKNGNVPKKLKLSEARGMADEDLVNGHFEDPSNRAIYERVIREKMMEDGYTNYFRWNRYDLTRKAQRNESVSISRTPEGAALGKELRAILATGCDFRDTDDPQLCKDFCADERLHDVGEGDLTRRQVGLLGLVRTRCRQWLREQSRT